jgi:hypothetical protein
MKASEELLDYNELDITLVTQTYGLDNCVYKLDNLTSAWEISESEEDRTVAWIMEGVNVLPEIAEALHEVQESDSGIPNSILLGRFTFACGFVPQMLRDSLPSNIRVNWHSLLRDGEVPTSLSDVFEHHMVAFSELFRIGYNYFDRPDDMSEIMSQLSTSDQHIAPNAFKIVSIGHVCRLAKESSDRLIFVPESNNLEDIRSSMEVMQIYSRALGEVEEGILNRDSDAFQIYLDYALIPLGMDEVPRRGKELMTLAFQEALKSRKVIVTAAKYFEDIVNFLPEGVERKEYSSLGDFRLPRLDLLRRMSEAEEIDNVEFDYLEILESIIFDIITVQDLRNWSVDRLQDLKARFEDDAKFGEEIIEKAQELSRKGEIEVSPIVDAARSLI